MISQDDENNSLLFSSYNFLQLVILHLIDVDIVVIAGSGVYEGVRGVLSHRASKFRGPQILYTIYIYTHQYMCM